MSDMNSRELQTHLDDFVKSGFVVVRNCIDRSTTDWAQQIMAKRLSELAGEPTDCADGFTRAIQDRPQYQVQEDLGQLLDQGGLYEKVFLSPRLLSVLTGILGPDLAYLRDLQIIANVKGVEGSYYLKPPHQEVWSGASPNSIYVWFPLMLEPGMGTVEHVPGSHTWGLLPNRDRRPTELPDNVNFVCPDMTEADALVFHTLTLHRSVPNNHDKPRLAITTAVRNFQHAFGGHQHLFSWKPFHLSPISKIQRVLGNPYLTPWRTYGSDRDVVE